MNKMLSPLQASKLDLVPMFSTHGRSNEELADFIADATRDMVDLTIPQGTDKLRLVGQFWHLGDISVNKGQSSGLTYQSDPVRHRRHEVIQLNCVSFGRGDSSNGQHDRVTSMGIAAQNPAGVAADAIDFFVPFERIGYDPDRDGENTVLAFDDPVGRILNSAMENVSARLPYASVTDGFGMVDNLCSLVRDLLLSNRKHVDRANLVRARRLAIDRYIDENLSTDLSASHLANVFAVSRTSLFRMFKEEGGIDNYVTRRRLHRAFHGLKAVQPGRGAVRRIAEKLGFFDAANFNRTFRREFGFRPSDLVGIGLVKTNSPEPNRTTTR